MIPVGFALAQQPGADPETAASGFMGFFVFFLLALAIWFLGRNLTGRLRRMNHQHAAEVAAHAAAEPAQQAEVGLEGDPAEATRESSEAAKREADGSEQRHSDGA